MAWLLPRFVAGLLCMAAGAFFGLLAGSGTSALIGALAMG